MVVLAELYISASALISAGGTCGHFQRVHSTCHFQLNGHTRKTKSTTCAPASELGKTESAGQYLRVTLRGRLLWFCAGVMLRRGDGGRNRLRRSLEG